MSPRRKSYRWLFLVASQEDLRAISCEKKRHVNIFNPEINWRQSFLKAISVSLEKKLKFWNGIWNLNVLWMHRFHNSWFLTMDCAYSTANDFVIENWYYNLGTCVTPGSTLVSTVKNRPSEVKFWSPRKEFEVHRPTNREPGFAIA